MKDKKDQIILSEREKGLVGFDSQDQSWEQNINRSKQMDSLFLEIWHSKLNKSDFKALAEIIKAEKEKKEQEEATLQQIPEEDVEPKEKKPAHPEQSEKKERKDKHQDDADEPKPEDNKQDEPEEEAEEESVEYESEEEDMETYQRESDEVQVLANERKILDETLIQQKYEQKLEEMAAEGADQSKEALLECKLQFIEDQLEEQNVIPLMNELMTRLIYERPQNIKWFLSKTIWSILHEKNTEQQSRQEVEALFDRFDVMSRKKLEQNRLVETLDMLGVVKPDQKLTDKLKELDKAQASGDQIDKATFVELCSTIASENCFKNE